MNLKNELTKFWEWANMTPTKYSITPDYGIWEIEYPNWKDLYETAFETIYICNNSESNVSRNLMTILLEAIAIDNEERKIISKCEIILRDIQLLYEIALTHIQPNARWQIAESISRTRTNKAEDFLIQLTYDKINYVKRSALISLSKINPKKAEKIAFDSLIDNDEYVRLFSLRVLIDLKSSNLLKAKEALKNDNSIFIQSELIKISSL